jgi:hypothetical protein
MAYWKMPRRALTGAGSVGVALLAALSCARFGYEPLEGALAPLPNDTGLTHAGGFAGGAGADDGRTGEGGTAPVRDSGGAGSRLDAGDTGESGVDAGVSDAGTSGAELAACGPAVPTVTWSFASTAEGWQLEADPGASGNLSWTGASGEPAPGALEIDATVSGGFNNVRIYLEQSPSDLSGKVVYARVFLESGAGVSAKVFAQTGVSAWGDGQDVQLDAQRWQCISFDPRDPVTLTAGFDRTAVHRIGVFFFGEASSRVYVDQVSY